MVAERVKIVMLLVNKRKEERKQWRMKKERNKDKTGRGWLAQRESVCFEKFCLQWTFVRISLTPGIFCEWHQKCETSILQNK